MLGCDCESNQEIFYRQIDFAPTFSILNGLPIPKASIGVVINEMLFEHSSNEKLNILKFVNQRLLSLVDEKSDEYKHGYEKAKSFHEMFANDDTNQNAFLQAEKNYLQTSRIISDDLGKNSLEMNSFQVFLGLSANVMIVITLLIPSDDESGKNFKFSVRSFIPFVLGSFVLKIIVVNEIFGQKNDMKSFVVLAAMMSVMRIIFGIFICKIDRIKKIALFDHDIIYILLAGHLTYTGSLTSSSFVEEEHQLWYYFCNSTFLIFAMFEIRSKRKDHISKIFMYIGLMLLHIIVRRLNQTGDKWIKLSDISDWLHYEANVIYLNIYVVSSLLLSCAWIVKFHSKSFVKSILIASSHTLLYFHHTRSIEYR